MPQVDIENKPLFERYGEGHPATEFLLKLYAFRRDFAGCELPWPGREGEAVECEWYSQSMQRMYQLSGVIYGHFCFDPVLNYWLHYPDEITDQERAELKRIDEARELLGECEAVNQLDGDRRIAEIIRRGREVLDVWEQSIELRIAGINAAGKIV